MKLLQDFFLKLKPIYWFFIICSKIIAVTTTRQILGIQKIGSE